MARNDQAVRPVAAPGGWADPMTAPDDVAVWRRWAPLLTWLGCLVAAIGLLRWLGGAGLAVPPVDDPSAWGNWLAEADPVTATVAILRVVAVGIAWYLTGVTSISVVARLLEAASLVRLADALSVGPIRVLVQQAVGVGLAASVLAVAVPTSGTAPVEDEVAVMTPIPGDPDEMTAVAATGLALRDPVPAPVPAPDPVVQPAAPAEPAARVEPAAPVERAAPAESAASASRVAPAAPAASAAQEPGPTLRERKIASGDHFWAIAEEEVAAQLGRPGTEDEVLDHWETLLVANADRLVVAGNADLLLPGQTIVLPEVTEARP